MTPSPAPLYPEQLELENHCLRICTICGIEQPIDNFEKNTRGVGRRWQCRKCRRASLKTGGRKKTCRGCGQTILLINFELIGRRRRTLCNECMGTSGSRTKRCSKCNDVKPISEFTRVSDNLNGLHSYCRECKRTLEGQKATTRAENKRLSLKALYESMEESSRPLPKVCGNPMCFLAGELQPPENFDTTPIHASGLRMDCRLCELRRRREGDPKESSREYHSRWYQENKDELNKRTKEWRDANPEECRKLHIKRRFRNYGVTQAWYEAMLAEQNGKCAICGSIDPKGPWNTFHVDHNHSCCNRGCHACDNCRRGLLCSVCNTRLGILEKDDWVRKAKVYLKKYARKDASGHDQPTLFDDL